MTDTSSDDRWTFLRCLREEGITIKLTDSGRFISSPKVIDTEIRAWIIEHRAAIVAELKAGEK